MVEQDGVRSRNREKKKRRLREKRRNLLPTSNFQTRYWLDGKGGGTGLKRMEKEKERNLRETIPGQETEATKS